MKYRSRTDIAAAILEIAQGGAIKTRIMYRAFLSSQQLKEYLEVLTDSGLLEYSDKEKEYATTEKGRRFLQMYSEVAQTISPQNNRARKTSSAA